LARKLKSGKRPKKRGKTVLIIVLLFAVLSIVAVIFIFLGRLTSYFTPFRQAENTYLSDSKNFGIDISHYQGIIDWTELRTSEH